MLSELSTITGGFLNVAGSGSYPRLPVDSADLKSSFQNTSIAPLLRPIFRMQNWIGIGIWIVLGATIGLVMKVLIKRPDETPGHTIILMVLGSFAAVIGGMLGVGVFHLYQPLAISPGGMAGGAAFSAMMTFVYRWGIRGLI